MNKKFPYQRGAKKQQRKKKTTLNEVSFSDGKILLDDFQLLGVTYFNLEKSSTNIAELQLKMMIDIKGLNYHL
ncbi:hypothetical protein M222_2250 [Enterococcus faecalis AZ19]|uniref:hypothetical protein n=1 Tax=Enterococcus faecalis TaxID=1351 RepID=UPI000459DD10|nr:hypothetical protein [Enterococcus faecalis]KAJ72480.1 hypothetical protein M222_2250 [Enterococcus faecalis AZ19]